MSPIPSYSNMAAGASRRSGDSEPRAELLKQAYSKVSQLEDCPLPFNLIADIRDAVSSVTSVSSSVSDYQSFV